MRGSLIYFVVLFSYIIIPIECARILGLFPSAGYSQFILAERLMGELASKGHQVTVISPFKPKTEITNYRTIHTPEIRDDLKNSNLFLLNEMDSFGSIKAAFWLGYMLTENTLKNIEVKNLLHSNENFDLIIMEQFYDEALMAFAYHFQAPLVILSSIGPSEWINHLMGNVAPASISTLSHSSGSRFMTFFQRLKMLAMTTYEAFYKHFIVYPLHQELINKYFPKQVNLYDILYNASLILLNSHPSTSENAPLVNGMVEIGGFHIHEKPLAPELQQFLDKADDGAIYFSLGTNLKSSDLTEARINDLMKVFGNLKQNVLWKSNVDYANKPKNVYISKWFNQSDILAHRNIQLFITHGGLLSMTETVFYGVPCVGIPIFGDQMMNIIKAERTGFGKLLLLNELNEHSLSNAINETLSDSRYSETARKMSNLMRDSPVRPLDLGIFWIESVIRNKGYKFPAASLNLYWYQLYMIDIAAFVLSFLFVIYLSIRFVLQYVKRQCCTSKKGPKIKKKKQ